MARSSPSRSSISAFPSSNTCAGADARPSIYGGGLANSGAGTGVGGAGLGGAVGVGAGKAGCWLRAAADAVALGPGWGVADGCGVAGCAAGIPVGEQPFGALSGGVTGTGNACVTPYSIG